MPAGRPKKPTAMKELSGTAQPCRMNPNEPRPEVGLPDVPFWVGDDPLTQGLFDQVSKYVADMQVGTVADGVGLAMLADQLALYLELRQQVREEGAVMEVEGANGQTRKIPHPALPAMQAAFGSVYKMLREYGLTAASRSNVDAQLEKEVNTFDDFMNM